MEKLQIGDVVCLKSDTDHNIMMTVSNISNISNPSNKVQYTSVDQYDVCVVYFLGGSLYRETLKHGTLAKISG